MPRLLIVEDEAHIATLLLTKFSRAGYDVNVASDGVDGVAQATEARPDVMLLDVMLPGLDGYAVCRAVRDHFDDDAAARPLIVMLSARSQATDRQRGVEAGCDAYITKPFRPAELLAQVEDLLRAREQR